MSDGQGATPLRTDQPSDINAQRRSEALKERVYVTFTALAVTITYERDAGRVTPGVAALTLALTVVGTLLAVFVSDVIAHMVRHGSLPSRTEMAHLVYVSFGSLSVLVVPMTLLGLSALGMIEVSTALRAISAALVATLIVVTLFAVRRLRIKFWLKVLALATMSALGMAVLAIELAVH